ncbi:hypothetical protein T4D_8681 [Trichinella pseudospiralis]|uniref:Uncharacterized protein n=1 Tax=Trichinella pseudospiralis TaxID=6337 RepID=A0A0V1FPS2_TRIPS|nr:hypothetical protein T4D_8681 [Trichinella pseudospiralis]
MMLHPHNLASIPTNAENCTFLHNYSRFIWVRSGLCYNKISSDKFSVQGQFVTVVQFQDDKICKIKIPA